MFTGLVKGIGTIVAIEDSREDRIYTIETPLDLSNETVGASISCSGVCLTALDMAPHRFRVQTGAETRRLTTAAHWQVGTKINLEPSLRVGDPLGGHMVTGHVDAMAMVEHVTPIGESHELQLSLVPALMPYISVKGSVTLDGVSLTVNEVHDNGFSVLIIPHTWTRTTLQQVVRGARLNTEVDILARYVARQLSAGKGD